MIKKEVCEVCEVCEVVLEGDLVWFSHPVKINGKPRPESRTRLYARVCCFNSDSRCLNRDESKIDIPSKEDDYG